VLTLGERLSRASRLGERQALPPEPGAPFGKRGRQGGNTVKKMSVQMDQFHKNKNECTKEEIFEIRTTG
jgi:hypothetical protein